MPCCWLGTLPTKPQNAMAWLRPPFLLTPLRRVGPRGSDEFSPISWQEALDIVATRMQAAINAHGPASILHTHYSGTLSLISYLFPNRLFKYLGASEVDPDSICNAAGHVAWHLMFGNSLMGFDPRTIHATSCLLIWGANPSHAAPHAHEHWITEAQSVVVIDPLVTATAAAADLHLQLRPGTDAALAFSLLHCLQANGGFDQSYIDAHTSGSDEIAADIARATPTWGEARTGVPAADIERAAALYGAGPALLWCGQGLQRQATGGNIMRAAALLPTLTGNIGKPGAGFCYLNVTPIFAGVDLDWLGGAEIARDGGKRVSHMELAKRLADPDEFKVFFTWNTNPLASAPEQNRLRAALRRDDLFTVVSDVFMIDTARYADIVLPAASFLEYDDITFSYFHLHMGAQSKIDEPMGDALPNAEIFRRLAQAMELDEPALLESDESMLASMMAQMDVGFDFAELKRRGHFAISDEPASWWREQKFDTPSGKIEIASAAAESMGLPRTPQAWADNVVSDGRLRLLSPASKWRLNDSYANDPYIDTQSGAPLLHLNPTDAERLGVQEGSAVQVANASGALSLTAHLDNAVLSGVAIAYKGRWPGLSVDARNVNFVHEAHMADMGESTAVHSTLVTVSLAKHPA